jgi:hypothetical protein
MAAIIKQLRSVQSTPKEKEMKGRCQIPPNYGSLDKFIIKSWVKLCDVLFKKKPLKAHAAPQNTFRPEGPYLTL